MKKPDLSIIIPVYNGQEYIGRCVDSILRQKNVGQYEIIAVNDGSTDETKQILGKYAKVNPNIRVINQSNTGVSGARNNGIRAAHGKYITFVDCDDMVGLNNSAFDEYFPTNTARPGIGNLAMACAHTVPSELTDAHFDDGYFVNMLNTAYDTDADVVLGGKITINYDDVYMRRHVYNSNQIYGTDAIDKQLALRQADVRENANFALYRRKMLDVNHLRFFQNMKLDEDILFCMLAVLYAQRVATAKDVTYFYNRHGNTLSNILNTSESQQKYKIANVQRFSVLLTEIAKIPRYSKLFNYWLKAYSNNCMKYVADGEFPPMECHRFCDQNECKGCFVADAMREQFKNNIAKYLNISK